MKKEIPKIVAVLTADVVKSTLMDEQFKERLLNSIPDLLKPAIELMDFQVYRGDEFQFTIANPEDALYAAVVLRTIMMTQTPDDIRYKRRYDVRVAIGIGPKSVDVEHDGLGYILSGHTLDRMRKERISIDSIWNNDITETLELHAMTADSIISRWSKRQAEVMLEWMLSQDRESVLKKTGIKTSTLSSFLKQSDARLLMKVIEHFRKTILKTTGQWKA